MSSQMSQTRVFSGIRTSFEDNLNMVSTMLYGLREIGFQVSVLSWVCFSLFKRVMFCLF